MTRMRTADRRLRAEWAAVALTAAAAAAAGWTLMADATRPAVSNRWLLVAGVALVYEVSFLRYHLPPTRREGSALLAALGLPNLVTLVRGMLYAVVVGFLLVPPESPAIRWAPGLCYGVGVALDFADGFLARRSGTSTKLGAKLDHAFDTLGFLAAPLVGVAWGRLPAAYLSLSAARYLFRAGCWWRRRRGRPVGNLPASRVRRPLAAVQMAFISVALVPVVPASVVFPAAVVAVVPSLLVFARDYLAVTGRLR